MPAHPEINRQDSLEVTSDASDRHYPGCASRFRTRRGALIDPDVDRVRDQGLAALERVLKVREAMSAAIHQLPRRRQVARLESPSDASRLAQKKGCLDPRGDVRIVREVGILDELIAEADRLADLLIVGAPG